jgi:hypothetical protein
MYKMRKELQAVRPQAAFKTRDELTVLLTELDDGVPQLIAHYPDSADFMPLFADRADAIARHADAVDHAWLLDRVTALLKKNGLQDNEYLPPQDVHFA